MRPLTLSTLATLALPTLSQLLPLHVSSRWILDSTNKRFKLKCINWAGHMESHIPEGLQHASADSLASIISSSGFNCVRLTFSIDMALSPDLKVSDSFSTLASRANVADPSQVAQLWTKIQENNPWIRTATVQDAFATVIDALGSKGIRVFLDNHVSRASWCCNLTDGNGWWDEGQPYFEANQRNFNTQNWLKGLAAMAKFSASHPAVAGIGLRNEIRETPVLQNRDDWYRFVGQGAQAVHGANPDLLIVVGGALSSTDATFLRSRPLDRSGFADKLVWEWHQYVFSPPWIASARNCWAWRNIVVGAFTGFLLEQEKAYTGPLWLSEFGTQLSGGPAEQNGIGANKEDYDYLKCIVEYAQGNDGDWALWALQGSYYVRDGVVDAEESWGLLDREWKGWRNEALREVLKPLFQTTQGP
ncbi:cellulase family protein [Westerdykella ornata]|uniref:Cellulase family protein n=1 Tax=Westerdykella ornata TaxID=318751 RepID=A0A6A6JF47_WESOR|nr:cellulase family protein [Westerdykella ornata]KAF2274256.1 cellulase family protein [Westerdykella ornata]